jgi:hypothetical protein
MQTKLSAPSWTLLLIGGWLAALGSPAVADTAKFYQGGAGYLGPFNAATDVYGVTMGLGSSPNCPSAGACLSDNIAGQLIFNTTSVQITANTNPAANINNPFPKVWGDFGPNFGGLGVQGTTSDDDDQINGSNVLHLHFASTVTLTGIGTLFASAHETFGPGNPATGVFSMSLDGITFSDVNFALANVANTAYLGGLNLATGQDFYFKEKLGVTGAPEGPEFYISALTYAEGGSRCTGVCGVPGPIAGAGLPGLLAGFGAMLAWYRKRRLVAA